MIEQKIETDSDSVKKQEFKLILLSSTGRVTLSSLGTRPYTLGMVYSALKMIHSVKKGLSFMPKGKMRPLVYPLSVCVIVIVVAFIVIKKRTIIPKPPKSHHQ